MTFFAHADEEYAYFASEVMALERQLGRELHPDVLAALAERSYDRANEGDGTLDVQAAWDEMVEESGEVVAEDEWEAEFDDGLQQLEQKLGRELFDSERAELYNHTSEFDVDPIKTFERLHGGKDPFNDPDNPDRSRIARMNARVDEVFSHEEFEQAVEPGGGGDEPDPAEVDDPEARRARGVEIADRAYAEQGARTGTVNERRGLQ